MRLTGDFKKTSKKIGEIFSHYFFHFFDIVRLLLDKKFSGKVPFFLEFCGRTYVEKCQKVPLSVFFRNCETFVQFCFSSKGPLSIGLMICDRRDEKCQSVPTFAFFGCFRRKYFDTLKSFCYF